MARFELGQLLITPGANDAMIGEDRLEYIARHARGDWGVIGDGDKKLNGSLKR